MKIPNWLSDSITDKDMEAIQNAVITAEAKTTAEIVPMIVRRSIVIGHVPLVLFLFFSALGLMTAPALKNLVVLHFASVSMVALDVAGLVVAAFFAAVLSRLSLVQRALSSVADTFHQVHARAHLEFETSNIRKTSLHTGILIFVSYTERKVVILADEAISSRLSDEVWLKAIEPLLAKIKKGRLAEGLSEAILRCGEMAQEFFPARADHASELGNELVIKE